MPALLILVVLVAPPATGDGPTVDPAALLRSTARGADQLQLVTDDGPETPGGKVLLDVRDPVAIAALLAVLDTEPVKTKRGIHHLCIGWPITVISRNGQVVARFSFDHEQFVRPHDDLWPWDAVVRPRARKPLARWYAEHGYPPYLEAITDAELKAASLETFFKAFPPQFQKVLRTQEDLPVPAALLARIAAETPSEAARFELVCRGLTLHPEEVGSSFEHQTLFAVAGALSNKALASGLLGVTVKGPLADGAARLVFDDNESDAQLARLSPTEAQTVVAKLAPVFLASERHFRLDALPLVLDRWWSPRLEAVWHAELEQTSRPRFSCYRTPTWLAAAAALANHGALSESEWKRVEAAPVTECPHDAGAVAIVRFLRGGALPTVEDVRYANSDLQEVFVKKLSQRSDWAAVDLGMQLVDVTALWSLQPWLVPLMRPGAQSVEPTYEQGKQLVAWWASAKASYPLTK
ncbi:MAG: hypothetical protein U0228_08415 [Myxococcaceae bacterium]